MMDDFERYARYMTGPLDKGLSSKAIAAAMCGLSDARNKNYPSDDGDFSRCYKLFNLYPEWRARLEEMSAVSPYWAALVKIWPDLERAHAEGGHVYKMIRAATDAITRADPAVVDLGNGMSLRFGA